MAAKPFSSRIRYSGSRCCTGWRGTGGAAGLTAACRLGLRDLLLHRLALRLRRQRSRPVPGKVGLVRLPGERGVLDERDVVGGVRLLARDQLAGFGTAP